MKVAAALLTSTSSGAVAPDRIQHGIDRGAVANVASDRGDLAAGIAAHLGRRRLQQFEPAAADDQFGAKLDEAASHRGAEPGAAAGDQYPLSLEQAFFEHRFIPTRHSERASPDSRMIASAPACGAFP